MKVFIDLTALNDNFSGIERYAASLALALIRTGKHEYILSFKNEIAPMFAQAVREPWVTYVVIPGGNKLVFNQLTLPWALRKIKADCYLFMAFPVPVLLMKRCMISTIHDICCWDCPESMKTLSKWYFRISQRIALLKCKKILTISEFSRKRIVERLRADRQKVELIYCAAGQTFTDHQKEPAIQSELRIKYALPERFVLSLSTLEPRKNLRLLVQAYEQLALEEAIEEDLVLVGRKGWKIDNLLEAVQPQVRTRIHFTGFVQDEDLPDLYGMARLFVFPSMYEGFGLPPLEAMACGTPVLSSDAASMPEVLGSAAGYFHSGNQEELAFKIKELLAKDESELTKLAAKGMERASHFDWNVEAQKLQKMLEAIVEP